MPRGRPPLPLTKEEALNARRDQVRKNVQAFRQRKSKQQDSNENSAGKPEELTLLLDNTPHCPDKHRSLDAKTSQHQYNKPWRDIDRMSGLPDYYLPFLLPQEINAAQMSLQQFAANAPKAFMPSGSSSEIGPHWSQVMPLSVGTNPILDLSIQALCLQQCQWRAPPHPLINVLLLSGPWRSSKSHCKAKARLQYRDLFGSNGPISLRIVAKLKQ